MSTVTIPFGGNASIKGTVVDSSVNRFSGIPFALPPVGEFRWQKPRKLPRDFFTKQSEPYDATGFKDSCLQPPSPIPHDPNEHPTVPPRPRS
jgi:carboxylesterase type B